MLVEKMERLVYKTAETKAEKKVEIGVD